MKSCASFSAKISLSLSTRCMSLASTQCFGAMEMGISDIRGTQELYNRVLISKQNHRDALAEWQQMLAVRTRCFRDWFFFGFSNPLNPCFLRAEHFWFRLPAKTANDSVNRLVLC